jgi:hypothetical protein
MNTSRFRVSLSLFQDICYMPLMPLSGLILSFKGPRSRQAGIFLNVLCYFYVLASQRHANSNFLSGFSLFNNGLLTTTFTAAASCITAADTVIAFATDPADAQYANCGLQLPPCRGATTSQGGIPANPPTPFT